MEKWKEKEKVHHSTGFSYHKHFPSLHRGLAEKNSRVTSPQALPATNITSSNAPASLPPSQLWMLCPVQPTGTFCQQFVSTATETPARYLVSAVFYDPFLSTLNVLAQE